MSKNANRAYKQTSARISEVINSARIADEPLHSSKADLENLLHKCRKEHPPASFRRFMALGTMTKADIQRQANWLAYGRAALEAKQYQAITCQERSSFDKPIAGMLRSIRELAQFLKIRPWWTLLTPGQSIDAVTRAEELIRRWEFLRLEKHAPSANNHAGWETLRQQLENPEIGGPTPGWDSAGYYGLDGHDILRVFRISRCRVGRRFDNLLGMVYKNGFPHRQAFRSGFSPRKIYLVDKGAKRARTHKDLSAQACYALGRLSSDVLCYAAVANAKPEQEGKPIRLRNLDWDAVRRVSKSLADIKAGSATFEQKKEILILLMANDAERAIPFLMKHFRMVQSTRDGMVSMELDKPLMVMHGVEIRPYVSTESYTNRHGETKSFRYCGWLATSAGGLSYHGNSYRAYKAVARDALSAWKRQRQEAAELVAELVAKNALASGVLDGSIFEPLLYIRDSLDAGNCEPGTLAFARANGWESKQFIRALPLLSHHEPRARAAAKVAIKRAIEVLATN